MITSGRRHNQWGPLQPCPLPPHRPSPQFKPCVNPFSHLDHIPSCRTQRLCPKPAWPYLPWTLYPSPVPDTAPTQKGSCKTAPAHPWTQFHLNSNQALAGSFVSPLTSSPGNTRTSLELCPVPARRSSAPVSPPPRLRLIPKPQLCPVSSYLYLGPTCVKKRCSEKLRSGRQGYEQVAWK